MQIRLATAADVPAIAAVHIQSWHETYTGLMPDSVLQGLSLEQRKVLWQQAIEGGRTIIDVAEDTEAGIVGFVAGGAPSDEHPDYDAAIYAIYLLTSHQGQGIGRALMETIAAQLQQAGYRALLLWVLATNPTRHFYERMGGMPIAEKSSEIDGAPLVEIAYGWPDIGQIGR